MATGVQHGRGDEEGSERGERKFCDASSRNSTRPVEKDEMASSAASGSRKKERTDIADPMLKYDQR